MAEPSDSSAAPTRPRLLVVDDERVVAALVGEILSDLGAVEAVTCGEDAVRRVADGARYGAILCDLGLPDVPGPDVYRRLLTMAPDQAERIIFVTGGTIDDEVDAFLAALPNHRLLKPFSVRSVRETVIEVLGQASP